MIHDLKMDEKYCWVVREDTSVAICPMVHVPTDCERYKKKLAFNWNPPGYCRLEECISDEKKEAENDIQP